MINRKNIVDKLTNVIYYTIVINQTLQPVKIVSPVFLRPAFIFGISPIFSHEKIEKLAETKRKIYNHGFRISDLCYDDGLEFIYFYTGGSKGGNEDIRTMLNYFQNSRKENATDKATEELNEIVEQVRNLPEVRNEYMTLGDIIDCEREEAAAKALKDALISCILTYFKKQGDIPAGLQEKLEETGDTDQLQSWYELALETKEVTEFMRLIGCNLL